MMRSILVALIAIYASPVFAEASFGTWQIDAEDTALFYVTTKKEHVAETHMIPDVFGGLSAEGFLRVALDMGSVQSGIEVRDGRLREHLFDVINFPVATFTAEIDVTEYESLSIGESMVGYINGDLVVVGTEGFVDFDVLVTRVNENRVVVSSLGPAIINGADFGLTEGIDKLRELAKLPSISYSVPVNFVISLVRTQ
ncbi:MAG: YceI family protein [Roseibium sp.]|uniref:YceI family protein n=1 Tax=Roseibium sp. TaxID=1936156 RepID=UPI002615BC47|nr:YceI family protein [Roseibium sp.]MCV0424132.1 YceI family protein [Roseibium sp.]